MIYKLVQASLLHCLHSVGSPIPGLIIDGLPEGGRHEEKIKLTISHGQKNGFDAWKEIYKTTPCGVSVTRLGESACGIHGTCVNLAGSDFDEDVGNALADEYLTYYGCDLNNLYTDCNLENDYGLFSRFSVISVYSLGTSDL